MTQKSALVTTVRGAGSSLGSFVRYHLHLGFDRLYLFFDDPQESIAESISAHPQVSIVLNDEQLPAQWQETLFYRRQRYAGKTLYLMDRQQLNAAVAIQYALQAKIDWLLHIDQDELLYAPEFFQSPRQTVTELFQNLTDRQIHHVNFHNHELLVDQPHYTDPFQQATLFKRSLHTLTQRKLTPQQTALIASVPQLPENFFFNYGNGKSAARVSASLMPDGVHDFSLPQQQRKVTHWQRRLAHNRLTKWASGRFPFIRQLSHCLLAESYQHHIHSKNPVILHYYNYSFAEFWRKYHRFRYFSQFKDDTTLRRLSHFHAEAHQVVRSGNQKAAEAFYEQRVVVTNPDVTDQLIEANLVCRITEPAVWLRQNISLDAVSE